MIRYLVPTKDRYGNQGTSEAMTLSYDMAEIARINWKGVSPFDVMNFSKAEFRPLGRQGMPQWCADDNAQYATAFCQQVLL